MQPLADLFAGLLTAADLEALLGHLHQARYLTTARAGEWRAGDRLKRLVDQQASEHAPLSLFSNIQNRTAMVQIRDQQSQQVVATVDPLWLDRELLTLEGRPLDVGAEKTFDAPKLKGAFKVPTLRNVAQTAPYMHSGRFATLRETVAFYTGGRGHAIPPGVAMQPLWHIWDPKLGDEELDRLVDFLQALSDETFSPEVPAAVPSGLPPVGNSPLAKSPAVAHAARTR